MTSCAINLSKSLRHFHTWPQLFVLSTEVKDDVKCYWIYKVCVGITEYTLLWEHNKVYQWTDKGSDSVM